jgi:uncharacterized protein YijF (DUF1287 family)
VSHGKETRVKYLLRVSNRAIERQKEIKITLSLASLADDDEWQIKDPSQAYDKRRLRELDFWFGATTPTGAGLDRREA